MLDQVLTISAFNCTRLVGGQLIMRLLIMFHTSSIMFRSRLLTDQSTNWILRSCSHVLTFFVCRSVRSVQEQDVAEKSCLHHHTDAIQILYGWKKVTDSLTLPYTHRHIGCSCWFKEDNIAHISCWYTTPHHYRSWELHGPFQTSRIVALIFSFPNQKLLYHQIRCRAWIGR